MCSHSKREWKSWHEARRCGGGILIVWSDRIDDVFSGMVLPPASLAVCAGGCGDRLVILNLHSRHRLSSHYRAFVFDDLFIP